MNDYDRDTIMRSLNVLTWPSATCGTGWKPSSAGLSFELPDHGPMRDQVQKQPDDKP